MAKPWRALGVCLGAMVLSVAAWAQPVVVVDDRARTVTLAGPAQRVVSVLPSLTETVCALKRCERLVGVDRYSSWPASVKRLPVVGGGLDPNVEAVLALKPDVVLMARSARGGERLEALGVRVVYLEPQTHADVLRALRVLGTLLGVPASDVDALWQGMQRDLSAAAQQVSARAKGVRVYVEVSPTPHAAGASSFLGETVQRLGLGNVVPADMGPFPQLSPEFVLRADPDVLVLGAQHVAGLRNRPGWARLRALVQQRVCAFDEAVWDTLVRPGPRMAQGAQALAACLADKTQGRP